MTLLRVSMLDGCHAKRSVAEEGSVLMQAHVHCRSATRSTKPRPKRPTQPRRHANGRALRAKVPTAPNNLHMKLQELHIQAYASGRRWLMSGSFSMTGHLRHADQASLACTGESPTPALCEQPAGPTPYQDPRIWQTAHHVSSGHKASWGPACHGWRTPLFLKS